MPANFNFDPLTAALSIIGMFTGGSGNDPNVQSGLSPEIKRMLLQQLQTGNRAEALVDPANFANLGFAGPPSDAVPLRAAANQLAFALLPNFVRPSNSLFPGTAPPFGDERSFSFGGTLLDDAEGNPVSVKSAPGTSLDFLETNFPGEEREIIEENLGRPLTDEEWARLQDRQKFGGPPDLPPLTPEQLLQRLYDQTENFNATGSRVPDPLNNPRGLNEEKRNPDGTPKFT